MKLLYTLPLSFGISKYLLKIRQFNPALLCLLSTLFFTLLGCSKNPGVTGLDIEVWLDGQPLTCNQFEHAGSAWTVNQFAFFISEISLHGASLNQKVSLADTPWQTAELSLIQPKLMDCINQSNPELPVTTAEYEGTKENLQSNSQITFTLPMDLSELTEIGFLVGVPFAVNHQNPLLQPSPLNRPSMFWSWRSGHKFFRLDLQGENTSWVFHLGSVGCEAESTMRSPSKECVQPNRIQFRLPKQKEGTKLVMHLDRLLIGTELNRNQSCLFHGGQDSCETLLENLSHQGVFEWQ